MDRPSPMTVRSTIVWMPAAYSSSSRRAGVDECRLLIPVGRDVLDDFGVHHEDVFVHQRGTELVGGDGAAQSLHVSHDRRLAP